jgi:hypothetical protein
MLGMIMAAVAIAVPSAVALLQPNVPRLIGGGPNMPKSLR